MLYRQSEISTTDIADQLMKSCYYLTEAESEYLPSMVSIIENKSIGCNTIRVEDLVEYSLSTGNIVFTESIQNICEANGVSSSNIAFTVSDVSILEDIEVADTVHQLRESGETVYVTPILDNDPYCVLTEAIVDLMVEHTGTDYEEYTERLFESYIMGDLNTIINEDISDTINNAANSVSSFYDNKKRFVSKQLAALNKKYRKLANRAHHATGTAKKVISRARDRVMQGIDSLKKKI